MEILVVVIAVIVFAVIVKFINSQNEPSGKSELQLEAQKIESRANSRVESLFSGTVFKESSNTVEYCKGMVEVYYTAFIAVMVGFELSELSAAVIEEIARRNATFRKEFLSDHTAIGNKFIEAVANIKEVSSSRSAFAIAATMRNCLPDGMYDELVQQKMLAGDILEWMNDAIQFAQSHKKQ